MTEMIANVNELTSLRDALQAKIAAASARGCKQIRICLGASCTILRPRPALVRKAWTSNGGFSSSTIGRPFPDTVLIDHRRETCATASRMEYTPELYCGRPKLAPQLSLLASGSPHGAFMAANRRHLDCRAAHTRKYSESNISSG